MYHLWLFLYYDGKWQSWIVVTETIWPTKPKILTVSIFAGKKNANLWFGVQTWSCVIDHTIVPILCFSLMSHSCHVTLNFVPLGGVYFSASLILGSGHTTCFGQWNMEESDRALVLSLSNNRNYMFLLLFLVFMSLLLGHIPHSIKMKRTWSRATGTELLIQNLK